MCIVILTLDRTPRKVPSASLFFLNQGRKWELCHSSYVLAKAVIAAAMSHVYTLIHPQAVITDDAGYFLHRRVTEKDRGMLAGMRRYRVVQ